jgi:leucyl aminopeptidase
MLKCFSAFDAQATPIVPVTTENFPQWIETQNEFTQQWIKALNYTAKAETYCLIPNSSGGVERVIIALKNNTNFWALGILPQALPPGNYRIEKISNETELTQCAIAWGLGAYQFNRYKANGKTIAKLAIDEACNSKQIENIVAAIYNARDLINTPTEDMGPPELAQAAKNIAQQFKAEINIISGDDLLKNNYPTIHAVGRASDKAPCLIDIRWGDANATKLTIVGKGVCFDTGGLDLKDAANMLLMKKDMGGAAHALCLAQMIMHANLPVRLRVLIPAVENAVAGNAYRPGDIIKTRQGLTVEISNTDAEGRLILCDALAEAVTEQPELLLDFATLTGAARVAVGTEISALFANNDQLADKILFHAQQEQDPVWRMPLYSPYRKMLDTPFADIKNAAGSSYAGSITAALFLKEFVPDNIPWAHFDLMAWNICPSAGHPEGGEVMALRAVFAYLRERFEV